MFKVADADVPVLTRTHLQALIVHTLTAQNFSVIPMNLQVKNVSDNMIQKAAARKTKSAVSCFFQTGLKSINKCLIFPGEDLNALAKCEFNGQTYYEGQRIDAESKCYSCFCEKGFENKPVEQNKHCHKINCNIELHYSARILKGCVPVYYKS